MSQRSIEDFKAALSGGGVRPTMFQVELTFPGDIVADPNQATSDGIFLIKAAALPAATVGSIAVPFRGRQLKVSGDRSFEDWQVTVTNDTSFLLRKAFEEWSEKIQNFNYVLGATTLGQYFTSAIVRQLDRDGRQLRAYRFEGIWPTNVGAIDLNFESTDSVEEYPVTFAVQYWGAIEDGDPFTSPVPTASTSNLNGITT
ncbi:T4-like tail tube protein [Synechococcus phage S-CRM01]|uniref:T4-like tail tube protein n=1 Tax=Synechococcus phage S-CRM01 TaxID=1026955 RepID=UPI000209E34F|nr:T4-like tail tube protein [Synechococcus phage S-CRM01]AEC52984.1 T4-like tail tube protein [Synechococcus phage S-CRM01]